ncbi:MAG TPA: hypothetical protein VGM67_01715 [Gemmatimonadaceae bacterium]|jgi:hypothetical protein
MEQEDYLLRMIASIGIALSRIRRMLFEGKNAEARQEIEHAAVTVGLDLNLLIGLDARSLRPFLQTGGVFDQAKCAFFAELVYLEWQREVAAGSEHDADRCAARASLLYSLAYEGLVMDEQTRQHAAELDRALS